MVSRENAVIFASMIVAIVAAVLAETLANAPDWASVSLLIGIGVVVPTVVNQYLDGRAPGSS